MNVRSCTPAAPLSAPRSHERGQWEDTRLIANVSSRTH